MKPWTLGSLVIGDEWQGSLGTWFSVLRGARGMPPINALLTERYGRFPAFSGVARPGVRRNVEIHFLHSTDELRAAARTIYMREAAKLQKAETPARMYVVDEVLAGIGPENLLVAFGPWDVYYDGPNWKARDLLSQVEGTLGTGWSIASDEGLNISGSSSFTLEADDLAGVEAAEIWWKPADDNTYASNRYLLDGGSLELYFRAADDKFVLTDGTTTLASAAQTFAADTLIHVAAQWGTTNGLKLYVDDVETSGAGNAVVLSDPTYVGSEATPSLPERGELVAVRFYEALTATMVNNIYIAGTAAGDDPLGNARWVLTLPERADPLVTNGKVTLDLVATMAVDDDVRWRSRDGDYVHWDVTGTPDTETVAVTTEDAVYPTLYLTPKSAKAGGFLYKRWVPVLWKAENSASNYPILLGPIDTAAIVAAAKAQANGDDWRVYVDDVDTDRWFGDTGTAQFDQTATKTWINLDWNVGQAIDLQTSIGAGDTITSIDADGDISGFPSTGILLINSEAFTYTGKSNALQQFLNVTRAAKGTGAAAHTASDPIYWIQHDVWIFYDDSTLSAPTMDDDYKPILNMNTSTNDSWDYDEFGENGKPRAGTWVQDNVQNVTIYTGNHGASADPWVEIGVAIISVSDTDAEGRFYLYNPCGVSSANYQNGEKTAGFAATMYSYVVSSIDGVTWTTEYTIPATSGSGWEAWSQNVALTSGSFYTALEHDSFISGGLHTRYAEAADVTVALNTTYTPDATINSEQSNYAIAATITNTITGAAFTLTGNLNVNDVLEIDTDNHTVTNLSDGSNLFSILEPVGGVRAEWLPLVNGNNELQYEEIGVADVDIDLVWDRRYFE